MRETITCKLASIERELRTAGISDARREAEIMLCETCGFGGIADIYKDPGFIPTGKQSVLLDRRLKKRKLRYPLAYILGKTHFFGMEFLVTEDTLVPRQETELLIEECIRLAPPVPRILEIGCGCGNIAVVLAKQIKGAKIISIDVSGNAVKVARENAKMHKTGRNVEFRAADVFDNGLLKTFRRNSFDMFVSNPPYVSGAELADLQREIEFEPRIAFYGGTDGFRFYRRIAKVAPLFLRKGGYLATEIGFSQALKVKKIYNEGGLSVSGIVKDYSGFDRVVIAGLNQWIK